MGISIPILMILLVAGSIYIPGLFIQPKYNFLYVSGEGYSGQQYSVQNNQLVKNEIQQPENGNYNPSPSNAKLFLYDISTNKSIELSFEVAQKLFNLDSNIKSPDGFEIVYGSSGNGIIFPFFFYSGTDYNSSYLKGHNVSKKLNIQLHGSPYDFRFLGWTKDKAIR